MIIFQISAPGRVALCGEYTAMYGKQVVVASLNIRTTLKFQQFPQESRIIRIVFPDVGISLDIPTEIIVNFMSSEDCNLVVDDYILFLRQVQYFITLHGLWESYEQRFSLQTFFFLLFFIARKEGLVINSFQVVLTTQLMIKAGLGSSTSFATCLAACFLHWACLQKGDHNEFTVEELTRISKYVMYSEEVIQNYVYHEDHNVCTRGYVTAFRCTGMLNVQSKLMNVPEINVLLVDANIRIGKSEQMKQLAAMKYRYSNAVDKLLNKINNISQNVVQALQLCDNVQKNENSKLLRLLCKTLEASFFLSQELLCNLRLWNENFRIICLIARRCGFRAKLAGKGASSVIILLPPYITSNEINNFIIHLEEEGFFPKKTTIFCSGVQLE